jgi:hypothetical protein
MTEAEWLVCKDADSMLYDLGAYNGKGFSVRKMRLFAAALCRRIEPLLRDEQSVRAVEVAERWADGEASDADLALAHLAAEAVTMAERGPDDIDWDEIPEVFPSAIAAAVALQPPGAAATQVCCRLKEVWGSLGDVIDGDRTRTGDTAPELEAMRDLAHRALSQEGDLLRDIFGNPFRPLTLASPLGTPIVSGIARVIYEERAFERLPILADALEDAGCADRDILDHLRGPGPHVRGCWVLDLILDKS